MQCRWIWATCLLTAFAATVGCTELPDKQSNTGSAGASASGCVDQDGDGFGDNCSAGRDCNDFNPTVTDQCFSACSDPSKGCDCNGDAPVPCFLDQTANPDGTIMCHEGTRYCRNGTWGACEDVHTYSVAPRQDNRLLPDVFPRRTCSDCEQNCFVAQDYLEYVPSGLGMYDQSVPAGQLEQIPAGGLTVARTSDAGVLMVDAAADMYPDGAVTEWPVPDAGPCMVGDPVDNDCDNIPDYYDPNPTNPTLPFAGPPDTIVSTTPTNIPVNVDIDDFEFRLTEADVYFALDVTRNQDVERQAFIDAVNNIGVLGAPTPNLVDRVVMARTGSTIYDCIDADGDTLPDNFRKTQGLVGAARCFVGDAYMGLGFMDEVPVRDSCSLSYGGITILGTTYGATTWTECHYGDDTLRVPFRNLFDLSGDDTAFKAAAYRLPQIATRLEIPQSGAQALWAVANGSTGDLYYGADRPAFGARRDCPAGTYGAGCFRSGVLPITFMFTDTGQHNGPTNYIPVGYKPPLTVNSSPNSSGAPYVANNLAFPAGTWGTAHAGGERALRLAPTGESVYAPLEVGTINDQRLTFTGSTIGMGADVTSVQMGCGANGSAPDAFIGFDIAANGTPVTITTTSTPYDSQGTSSQVPGAFSKVIGLFTGILNPTSVVLTMPTTAVAPINVSSNRFSGNGASATFPTGLLGNVSRCGADGSTGEARLTFTPTANMTLVGDLGGSGSQAVIDIYQDPPLANPVVTASGDTNDTFATAYVINTATAAPNETPGYVSFSGNTAAPTLPINVPAGAVGCGADATTRDAVYRFHLDNPTRVTIDTEGSAIDTVISLHYGLPIETVTYSLDPLTGDSTAFDGAGAISNTGYDISGIENTISQVSGDTSAAGSNADYLGSSHYSCFGPDNANDHVVHFSLSTPTQVLIRDTDGADGYDPAVAIFGGTGTPANRPPAPFTPVSLPALVPGGTGDNASAGGANAWSLGDPVGKQLIATGNTATATADYNAGQFTPSCTNSSESRDVVYAFTPSQNITARIRVDGTGGTPLTNSMIALFNQPPSSRSTTLAPATPLLADGSPITLNNTVPIGFASNTGVTPPNQSATSINACGMNAGAADAFYRFDVPAGPAQEVQFRLDRQDTPVPAYDPVLRLYRGVPITTSTVVDWDGVNNRANTAVHANGQVIAATNASQERIVDFGNSSSCGFLCTTFWFSNSTDNSFCGTEDGTRDAVFRFNLTSNRRVRLRAWGESQTAVAMAILPATATLINPTVATENFGTAEFARDAANAIIPCTANNTDRVVDLVAGDYYVVVKATEVCSGLGCLLNNDDMQDDRVHLTIMDENGEAFDCNNDAGLAAPNANSSVVNRTGANALTTGSYYLALTGATAGGAGNFFLSATRVGYGNMACANATSGTATITTPMLTAGQTYYLVVKGQTSAAAGQHRVTIQDITNTDPDPTYCLAANQTTSAVAPVGTKTLPAGDYWAVIKGTAAGSSGNYVLELADQLAASGSNRVTPLVEGDGTGCDDNAGAVATTSRIVADLTPTTAPQNLSGGDYWVVVKGGGPGQSGPYQLNIRDHSAAADNVVACANAATSPTFTANLTAGVPYTAVIKGSDATEGNFNAFIYDQLAAPTSTACNASSITTTLNAGHHIVGIKGSTAGALGNGEYQVNIAAGAPPSTPATIPASQRAFASKTWGTTRSALLSRGMKVVPMQSCEPGTDWGTGTGDPNTGGTSGAFNACGDHYSGPLAFILGIIALTITWIPFVGCILFDIIAIIFVLIGLVDVNSATPAIQLNPVSCDTSNPDALYASVQEPAGTNPPRGAWPQSKEIARTTDTVTTSGTPIAYWLRRNPTSDTVAYDVADALYQLATEIRMDVSINMVWDSVTPPGYVVNATAVTPTPCVSAAGSTHRDCSTGDQPDFQVSFLNPALTPVAQSTPADFSPPTDWHGGWPGRLVVLGDGQFVLQEIPVFLIPPLPSPMGPPMPPPRYSGPAIYYQDISTRECMGNNLPDWTDLFFNAEMPPGTRIGFRTCAENDPADLGPSCMMQTVATVTATNTPCFNDAQCRGMNGFCGNGGPDYPGGYCQVITPQKHKGLCGSEAECPDGPENGITPYDLLSDCVSGECEYDSQPADMGAALGGTNFRRNSRVEITLYPDPTLAFAPNLLDWAVTYVCTPNQ